MNSSPQKTEDDCTPKPISPSGPCSKFTTAPKAKQAKDNFSQKDEQARKHPVLQAQFLTKKAQNQKGPQKTIPHLQVSFISTQNPNRPKHIMVILECLLVQP